MKSNSTEGDVPDLTIGDHNDNFDDNYFATLIFFNDENINASRCTVEAADYASLPTGD